MSRREIILRKDAFPWDEDPTQREKDRGYDWKTWPIIARLPLACEGSEAFLYWQGNISSNKAPFEVDESGTYFPPDRRWTVHQIGDAPYMEFGDPVQSPDGRPGRPWRYSDNVSLVMYESIGGAFPPPDSAYAFRGTGEIFYHQKQWGITQYLRWTGELEFPQSTDGEIGSRKAALMQYDVDYWPNDHVDAFCVLLGEP